MFVVPTALAIALLGGITPQLRAVASNGAQPAVAVARTCMAPTQTGIYRITATDADSTHANIGMVLLENVEGCLEATLITDEGGPAIIDHIDVKDDVITGSIRMPDRTAKISLRISSTHLDGSIVAGNRQWRLTGRRTS